jgi:hypothetical protein
MISHDQFFCIKFYLRIFLLFLFAIGLYNCDSLSDNKAIKSEKIVYINFDNNLEDQFKRAQVEVNPPDVTPDSIISYVEGFKGMAVRTSHNAIDDGGGDFEISHYKYGWPESNEIYISYYLKLESGYDKAVDEGFLNFKQFWSFGQEGHQELIMQNIDSNSIVFAWQISGNAGWNKGTEILNYSEKQNYRRDDWMHLEIFIKKSSGDSCQNSDGICWFKLNGNEVIYGDDVVTGNIGNFRSPALKTSGDSKPGKGWWQIDEYEMWNGVP